MPLFHRRPCLTLEITSRSTSISERSWSNRWVSSGSSSSDYRSDPAGNSWTLFVPNKGRHPEPLWAEAETKLGAGGFLQTHPGGEAAGAAEGSTVGGVWGRKGPGLRRLGQRVVLPHVQGDVQPVLWTVWVFCHVCLKFHYLIWFWLCLLSW